MTTVLYDLGLALLFTHELDAMTHSEWRLLFVLRSLPDESASWWFVVLHVPLFFLILWLSHVPHGRLRAVVRTGVAAFLVVHGALHFLLSSQDAYAFAGALSNGLIFGAGACGLAYLATRWSSARSGGSRPA